jgi:hypothetical protein
VDAMNESSDNATSMIENQNLALTQNAEIISGLSSITQAFESYFGTQANEDVTDQEIMNLISG